MCIGGYKYDACNGALPNWEMILSNSSGELDRARTNGSGYYQFCNLSPGAYRVCETLQDDWLAINNVDLPGCGPELRKPERCELQ